MPKLNDVARANLDSAIKSFPSGKVAGPVVFGPEFYKRFSNVLFPPKMRFCPVHYTKLTFLSFKKTKMKPTQLVIGQLHYKILITKVLAMRLNKHLSSIIHPDQTGFIPGRFFL